MSDQNPKRIARENLDTMELLAATDPKTFSFLLGEEGLKVAAIRERDPLVNRAMPEDVAAIASTISEEDEDAPRLDSYQQNVMDLAQDYGYIVGV